MGSGSACVASNPILENNLNIEHRMTARSFPALSAEMYPGERPQ
jgi:hypothetical protein